MRLASGLAVGMLVVSSAYGQYVISAHSGVIQLVEGKAFLNGQAIEPKFGKFPEIKDGQDFRTEEGRAEILLTPGVFLRMGEQSSIRMISSRLSDTRVEVLGGSVMVECDEIPKDNAILLSYKDDTMMLVKHGLYRVDTNPARFQVYDGEAVVKAESGQLTLKAGKATSLDGVLMAENFDKNSGDELYNWSMRRASYLARANVSSATALRSGGYYGSGFYGSSLFGGGWQWNPLFGLFTFVPYAGIGYSPFGFGWWSPYSVVYAPMYYGGGAASGRSPTNTAVNTARGVIPASSPAGVSRSPVSAAGGMSHGSTSAIGAIHGGGLSGHASGGHGR